MVLGAGLGTRLKPFTLTTPKALIPVLGVPAIEFSLLQLRDAGVTEVVVNAHSQFLLMKQYIESQPVEGLKLILSDESESLLGSAGGLRKALDHFEGKPFLAMNADVLQLLPVRDLMARHQELRQGRKVVMTLALLQGEWLRAQTGKYRKIEVNESTGLITGFSKEQFAQTPFFTGMAVYEREAFESLPFNQATEFVPQVLEPWIPKRRVGFSWVDALWMDIGSPKLWWHCHFELFERFRNAALPQSWMNRISLGLKTLKLDTQLRSIDYSPQASEPLGKNQIRYENQVYAISNLGHS